MDVITLGYLFLLGGIVFLCAFLFYGFYSFLPVREVKVSSVNNVSEYNNGLVVNMVVVCLDFDSNKRVKIIKCIGTNKSKVDDKTVVIYSLFKPNSFVKYHYLPMFQRLGIINIPYSYPEMWLSLILGAILLIVSFVII